MSQAPELVTVTIDGRAIQVARGASLLHTCLDNGAPVPYFCDHRKLDPIGACRMCVVQIENQPKLATACTITVTDGMAVHTESDEVVKARRGVLEFLLINHPLDCPVCDKGGECDLQDFAFYHGSGESRFIDEKIKYPKPVPLSDKILLDMERCVLCERCVRFFDEVTEEGQLVLLNRGVHTMIGTFNGEAMDSQFQGNVMEICPVGALTSVDWRFTARPWDMRSTPSVCHGCAVGCNVQVQARDDRLVRYMSRENPHIDDGWLCDRGRYGFHFVHSAQRLLTPRIGVGSGTAVPYGDAVRHAGERLQVMMLKHTPEQIGAIVSPECTNEELFLAQRWVREVVGTQHIDHRGARDPRPPGPADFELGIDGFADCQAIFILGDQATVDLGPIVELRLKLARRKHGARLILANARPVEELIAELRDSDRVIGVIASEALGEDAALLARRVVERGAQARRMTLVERANSRGAADMGCLPGVLPGYRDAGQAGALGTWEMLEAAADGRLPILLLVGASAVPELRESELLQRALAAAELVVTLDTMDGPLARAAEVAIPLHTFAEKEGTYTNLEGRVQRLRPAIPPVAKTPPDWRVLQDLANAWEAGWSYSQPADVMRDIIAAVPAYRVERAGDRARWWAA